MHPDLQDHLHAQRRARRFQPGLYLEAKVTLLNDYMRRCGLRACLVGVSGGIDSAVTLGIVRRAAEHVGSPIRRVVAALMPMFVEAGATGQDVALRRGRLAAERFGAQVAVVDLSHSKEVVQAAVETGAAIQGRPFAAGQLVSYLRTPALYYLASLLSQEGFPCLFCGTTNRDEGGYIGFFGKASDGMVDLQLISDVHKSEVRALAELIGVPEEIVNATPTGDTYDGRVDEEMIGAPYDFLELYTGYLAEASAIRNAPGFAEYAAAVEDLHQKNLHKYLADSPAVHLDVYPRAVCGGWRSAAYPPQVNDPIPQGLVGQFSLQAPPPGSSQPNPAECLQDLGSSAVVVDNLLNPEECRWLLDQLNFQPQVAANQHGYPNPLDTLGSYRATAHSPEVADWLWKRLAPHLPALRVLDEYTPTDGTDHPVWRALGINPVLRFITYPPGGWLVPHYDAGYDFRDGRRHTLMSLVVNLTDGGATRFLLERQRHLPTVERDHRDWDRPLRSEELLTWAEGKRGRALVFDHRLLHDAEPWAGPGNRVLLRSDIIFERCGLQSLPMPVPPSPHGAPAKRSRDPYYRHFETSEAAEEAGFFEDSGEGPDQRYRPDWQVTPLDKITQRLSAAPPDSWLAVLVTTGALCPVHLGHLELMERARRELEAKGATVLGGYLSPSHDEYVHMKCGPQVPGAAHRLHLCQQAVKDSEWLMVDPWESLHTDVAVNFTDVLERLGAYLAAHVPCHRPIHAVYVFGSDNARFALTFARRGTAVCVPRDGYPVEPYRSRLQTNPRVYFAEGPAVENLASSRVRQGDDSSLHEDVRELWSTWKFPPPAPPPALFYLRDEGDWCLEPWSQKVPWARLRSARANFLESLVVEFRRAFGQAQPPDLQRAVEIRLLRLDEQRLQARALAGDLAVLSLDPCLAGEVNLGVSRCFTLCDSVARRGLGPRPGWPDLENQLAAIPPGRYLLMDDDCASGRTLAFVRDTLPAHCEIIRSEHLCQVGASRDGSLCDLADSRDFLIGSREGGLVVALPDTTLARSPYLLPYVQPAERLSIPLSQQVELSRRVWQLNRDFFATLPEALRLSDAWPSFRRLGHHLGFGAKTSLEEIAAWHVDRLH